MTLLEVGRVERAHGVRGEVVVSLVTDRVERLAPGSVLDAGGRQVEVIASRRHGRGWIVAFAGIEDRNGAETLHGATLRAEPLDDAGELWVHELIGAPVVTVGGDHAGTVEAVQANPASDLLVLDTGALVPVRFVVEQRGDRTVVIDPPEGLLELAGPDGDA